MNKENEMNKEKVKNLEILDKLTMYGQEFTITGIDFGLDTLRISAKKISNEQIDELRKMAWQKLGMCEHCLSKITS